VIQGGETKKSFDRLLGKIKTSLIPHGYVKKKSRFVKVSKDNCSIIEFQKSQQSSKLQIKFTINLAICFPELWDPQYPSIAEASSSEGHIIMRIGSLFKDAVDFWWCLNADTSETYITRDVEAKIEKYALPFMARYPSVCEAKAAWEMGNGLGSTSRRREYYLSVLK
jgi:Domain of unknown function (DUF4304)